MSDHYRLPDDSGNYEQPATDGSYILASDIVTLNPDVAGDSWWGGQMHSMASVPRAGAAAALAITVAIAGSFNYNDDGVPSAPQTTMVAPGEGWQVFPIGDQPLPVVFAADEQIVPQPAPPALDEGAWTPPRVLASTIFSRTWSIADDLPTRVDQDYWWQAPQSVTLRIQLQPWADEETVPQPVVIALEDDYWFALQAQVEAPRVALGQAQDDIVQAPAPFVPVEDYWLRFHTDPVEIVVLASPPGAGTPQPPPGAFVPVEYYWHNPRTFSPPAVVRVFSANEEIVPQGATGGAGAGAYGSRVVVNARIIRWSGTGDDIVPQPAPLQIVESDWQVYTPPRAAPKPLYLPDPEQVPAGSLVAAPVVTEDDWQVYVPPLQAAKPLYLPDPEEVPAGSLSAIPSEEYWQPAKPQPPVLVAKLWAEDDQIVPQPAPITIDESDWNVYTPPLVAALPLYLPDPEEIPAGSLIPTPPFVEPSPPATPGRTIRGGRTILPDQSRVEDDSEKRARRARDSTSEDRATQVIVPPLPDATQAARYTKESARLVAARNKALAEAVAIRARIAEIEARQSSEKFRAAERQKLDKRLTILRQELQMAQLQEAVIMEELEVLDVAYVAMIALAMMTR